MNETENTETGVALYPLIRNDVRPRVATEEEKEAHAKEMRLSFEEKVEATLQRNRGEGVRSGLDGYVVGGIGVEEGVSSTGRRCLAGGIMIKIHVYSTRIGSFMQQ